MENDSRITQIKGRAVPVRGPDIDTDRIIPGRYLRTVTFADLGEHVFEDDRASGGHPFDDPRFRGASILIASENFGCGSSREHAPQALMRWGLRAFVGESFAEIFFGNCVALGLPCFRAAKEDVARLTDAVEAEPAQELILDIAAQAIHCSEGMIRAAIPHGPRERFLSGSWDSLGQLLEAGGRIDAAVRSLPYASGFTTI